jgi:hypothetical protein
MNGVRRTLWLALVVLAFGVAAATAYATPVNEGTLSIKRGDATLLLDMRGVAIGRLTRGVIAIDVPASRKCESLKVWGYDEVEAVEPEWYDELAEGEPFVKCEYTSRDNTRAVRFRLTGKIRLDIKRARNLHLSAAGRGWGIIEGNGGADGVWSRNGRPERSIPDVVKFFDLQPDEESLRAPSTE